MTEWAKPISKGQGQSVLFTFSLRGQFDLVLLLVSWQLVCGHFPKVVLYEHFSWRESHLKTRNYLNEMKISIYLYTCIAVY